MTKYNPTGLLRMNMNGMSEDEFVTHNKRARYLAAVVIDSNHVARRLSVEAGVMYPVSRIYKFDPRPDNDKPEHVKEYARARYKDLQNLRADAKSANVLFYINNERGFEARDFMFYCELIKLSIADPAGPIGLVFWNGASGAVRTGFWGQPNDWSQPWALEFLKLMHKHRQVRLPSGAYAFVLGTHNYTSQYNLIAVNAGSDRKRKGELSNLWDKHNAYLTGEKRIDWRLAQDHIGRDYQGIMKALGYAPNADGTRFVATSYTLRDDAGNYVMCPWLLPTEVGFDNMNDVRNVHGDELIPMAAGVQRATDSEYVPVTIPEMMRVGVRDPRRLTLIDWLEHVLNFIQAFALVFYRLTRIGTLRVMAFGLDTPRGYRSLVKTWAQSSWFPGKPAGLVMAYQMEWNWKVIHSITEVTIAQIVFCEGRTSIQWLSYILTGDWDYLRFMESEAALVEIPDHFLRAGSTQPEPEPEPEEPPPPAPGNDRAVALISTPPPVNIRAAQHPSSADIGDLYNGEIITILGQGTGTDGKQWLYIRRHAYGGVPEITGYVTLGNNVVRWQPLQTSGVPAGSVVVPEADHKALLRDREQNAELRVALADVSQRDLERSILIEQIDPIWRKLAEDDEPL